MKYFLFVLICLVLITCTKPNDPIQNLNTKYPDHGSNIHIELDTTNVTNKIIIDVPI
jgi:hypothetical protein